MEEGVRVRQEQEKGGDVGEIMEVDGRNWKNVLQQPQGFFLHNFYVKGNRILKKKNDYRFTWDLSLSQTLIL